MTFGLNQFKSTICLVLLVGFAASAPALSKRGKTDLSLEQLTKQSDDVITGKVKGKKTGVVGRHIETDYEVEVSESLKGKSFGAGSSMQMTVIGGALTTPPLTQFVEAQPQLIPGEEVALFLKTKPLTLTPQQKAKIDPKSKLATTPRVVGMNQGKFSIITDEKGGRKLTRVNLEERGLMPADDVLSRTLNGISTGKMRTSNRPVVPAKSVPGPGDDRDPLETTGKIEANNLSRNLEPQHALEVLNSSGPLPVQDFEEFRIQVKQFSQE